MVSSGVQTENKVDPDRLEHEQSSDSESQASEEDPGRANASNSYKKCAAAAAKKTPEEAVQQHAVEQVDRGGISTIVSEDSHSDSKVSITSTIRVKVTEDGYNWRKYGQKLVKGNVFVRSYYRCTYPTCMVKKQLERTHDGKITDTVYFGQHHHPKPQPQPYIPVVEEKLNEEHASRISQDKTSIALGQTLHKTEPADTPQRSSVIASDNVKDEALKRSRINGDVGIDDTPDLKREKKRCNVDVTVADNSTVESRVVQTHSEIDIVNDGYRWRKYGQKLVKGNPNPRSYYRCSSPGCPVKKHVERASHDPKLVVTTYENHHDHDMPPARTVTLNSVGSTADHSDEMKTKSVGSSIGHDSVVQASKNPRSNSSKLDSAVQASKDPRSNSSKHDSAVQASKNYSAVQANKNPRSNSSKHDSAVQASENSHSNSSKHDSAVQASFEGQLVETNDMLNATEASDGIVFDMVVGSPGVAS